MNAPNHGYWLVDSEGGVYNFGDAHLYRSVDDVHFNKPIVVITT